VDKLLEGNVPAAANGAGPTTLPASAAELWAVLVTLLKRNGAPLKGSWQRQVHAAFLHWLQAVDPELTAELHRPNVIRPFTVAMLPSQGSERSQIVSLRCTLLDHRVFRAFMQRCLPAGGSGTWILRGAELELTAVTVMSDEGGWTGWTNFASLISRARPSRVTTIEFITPTAFSLGGGAQGSAIEDGKETAILFPAAPQEIAAESAAAASGWKRIELFPHPHRVWESWARKWNAFAPPPLRIDLRRIVSLAERGLVADYELQTVTLDYGRFPQKGFIGWVRYEFRAATVQELQHLNALADFAFYAGTGYKTAQGMGQTRRRP
jgi:CRISPR-associated endoribonuclease Cas6